MTNQQVALQAAATLHSGRVVSRWGLISAAESFLVWLKQQDAGE
jgi:hypothetical protein